MKQLGSLTLPDTLAWSDETHSAVWQSLSYTLAGVPVVCNLAQSRAITLTAGEGSAWLDVAAVAALLEMAAGVGDTFPLVWEDQTYTVAFRHHQPPAVAMTPLWPLSDRYSGSIHLMVV